MDNDGFALLLRHIPPLNPMRLYNVNENGANCDLFGMVHMDESPAQTAPPFRWTLYSYVVTHDTGFAPNPFFGYCTLACCKPVIRRTAHLEDWVVGLSPKAEGNRVKYFMKVDEILPSFDLYWRDRKFAKKKPRYDASVVSKCGDNIYEPQSSGEYRQLRSTHSHRQTDVEDLERKAMDLRGKRILISETYAYFGAQMPELPPSLDSLIVGRGHKCRFSDEVKVEFLRFVKSVGLGGVRAVPRQWRNGDDSWMRVCGGCAGIDR
jgi:hypothetical protein